MTVILVIAVFLLLTLGGTVTSHRAGLSVPDWPTSFGHGIYSVPWSLWNHGGAFWEHSHRLVASLVGLLTVLTVVSIWLTQRPRSWLLALAAAALLLVIVQGVMGGLRVTQHSENQRLALTLAVIHGVTGQLFLCVCVVMAAALSRWWLQTQPQRRPRRPATGLQTAAIALLIALFVQLVLGASMRHTGAGAAIPDFPTTCGRLLPPFSQQGISAAAATMGDVNLTQYATPGLVGLHFLHRLWALVVLAALAWVVYEPRDAADQSHLVRPVYVLVALAVLQLAFAAMVIWTRLQPEFATAHQATGAAILALAVLLVLRSHLAPPQQAQKPAPQFVPSA